MIDTIRFEIPYSNDLVQKIMKKGTNVTVCYDSDTKEINYRYLRGYKPLGSYDRAVNMFIYEDRQKIYLELSIPKFAFGHNVFMLYPNELEMQLYRLWANLNRVYEAEFPNPETWLLNRLDICYNWRFQSQEQAESVFYHIKNFKYPKKSKQTYKTGLFIKAGNLHSLKFYLKQPEFFAHDYPILKKNPNTIEMAYQFHTWSAGVLRFEVSLKLPYITQLAKKFPPYKRTYHFATQNDIISALLGEFLDKYLKLENKHFMTVENALQKLESVYPKQKAQRLATFWYISHTQDEELVRLLFDYNRSTVYRNNTDIKKAGIGIYSPDDILLGMDLKIPSTLTTNEPLLSPAETAEAEGGGGEQLS